MLGSIKDVIYNIYYFSKNILFKLLGIRSAEIDNSSIFDKSIEISEAKIYNNSENLLKIIAFKYDYDFEAIISNINRDNTDLVRILNSEYKIHSESRFENYTNSIRKDFMDVFSNINNRNHDNFIYNLDYKKSLNEAKKNVAKSVYKMARGFQNISNGYDVAICIMETIDEYGLLLAKTKIYIIDQVFNNANENIVESALSKDEEIFHRVSDDIIYKLVKLGKIAKYKLRNLNGFSEEDSEKFCRDWQKYNSDRENNKSERSIVAI